MAGREDQLDKSVVDHIMVIDSELQEVIDDMLFSIARKYEWNTYEIEKWVKQLKRIQEKL